MPQSNASLFDEDLAHAAASEDDPLSSRRKHGSVGRLVRDTWRAWRNAWSSPLVWLLFGLLVLLAASIGLILAARYHMPGGLNG